MRHHAVQAAVIGADRHHDHLLLGLGQAVGLAVHQRIVIGEEGAEFRRPMGQHEEHVGNETGLFLHGENPFEQVGRQRVEAGGQCETADRLSSRQHHGKLHFG